MSRERSLQIDVRSAIVGDAEAITAILNPIIEARVYTAFDTTFTVEAERAFIQNLPARAVLHVAEDRTDRRVVGFQIMEPFASYTHAFDHVATLGTYVDLDRRRQDIATGLFQATFAAAVQRGFEKIFTFVRADNDGALRTYLRQGFQVIGRARNHARIDGRYVDEVLIEKNLRSPDRRS